MRECAVAEWAAFGAYGDGRGRRKQAGQRWLPMNAESPVHQANGVGAGIGEQKGGKLRAVQEEKGSGSDKTVFPRAVLPVGETKGVMFQACAALSAAKLHMA